jgi:hypothetical protein
MASETPRYSPPVLVCRCGRRLSLVEIHWHGDTCDDCANDPKASTLQEFEGVRLVPPGTDPVHVTEHGSIIKGHTCFMLARSLGMQMDLVVHTDDGRRVKAKCR